MQLQFASSFSPRMLQTKHHRMIRFPSIMRYASFSKLSSRHKPSLKLNEVLKHVLAFFFFFLITTIVLMHGVQFRAEVRAFNCNKVEGGLCRSSNAAARHTKANIHTQVLAFLPAARSSWAVGSVYGGAFIYLQTQFVYEEVWK